MELSIIIPVFNAESTLNLLISSLKSQSLDRDRFEIIFIDNGSTDKSKDIIQKEADEWSNIHYISYTKKQSSYASRNAGIETARGKYVAFTDADCCPRANWADSILSEIMKLPKNFLLSGHIELVSKNENFNHYEWYDSLSSLDQKSYSKKGYGATANLTVPVSTIQILNGFKEATSGGDKDFCLRAKKEDIPLIYIDKIIVEHPTRNNHYEIVKKLNRIAIGKAELPTSTSNLKEISKCILGSIIQLNQFRMIETTFRSKQFDTIWKIRFIPIALHFGFRGRIRQIIEIIKSRQTGATQA